MNLTGIFRFILSCILYTAFVYSKESELEPKKLILFILDGARHDYVNYPIENGGFLNVTLNGIRASYLEPVFPSLSFPNFYSINTGQKPEGHGFVHNTFFDDKLNKTFEFTNKQCLQQKEWWVGAEPIWVTATKQRRRSYLYYWPTCGVAVNGVRPAFCEPYFKGQTIQDISFAVNEAFDLLVKDTADFIGIYVDLADEAGHLYGPESPNVVETMAYIDGVVNQLMFLLNIPTERWPDSLEKPPQKGKDFIDVMIVSDHGMTSSNHRLIIEFDKLVDIDKLERIIQQGYQTVVHVFPKLKERHVVYKSLLAVGERADVYWKHNIPDELHNKQDCRVPPILIVARPNYVIRMPGTITAVPDGMHGYVPTFSDMNGMFYGIGPHFKKNFVGPPVKVTDLYQIMCHILDITPAPHSSTWVNVKEYIEVPGQYPQEDEYDDEDCVSSGNCQRTGFYYFP